MTKRSPLGAVFAAALFVWVVICCTGWSWA